jgi:uncharacterized cysteine cluster protein YcgN (CxxCxxCC family)
MDDPIDRTGLRDRYWERVTLKDMTPAEWEALCDGCGKCCLNKLEDADTGEVFLTRLACRLLDCATCRCGNYAERKRLVPECIVLTPRNLRKHVYWMPETCAYRRLHRGEALPDWHPLLTGDPATVRAAGVTVTGLIPEWQVPEADWEDHVIEEPV